MNNVVKYVELRKRFDEIDIEYGLKATKGFYQSRLLIFIGEWEKGAAIISFLGGVEKKLNYLALERETGRSDSSLKIWHELYQRYPYREKYITEYAEPKALAWSKKALLPAHVAHATGENEWDTPTEYIEAARSVMGSIDTDPATNDEANKRIKANLFYTPEIDGRDKAWKGNVWMNPPYAQPLIVEFCDALINKYNAKEFNQACVLVNNATETSWFQAVLRVSDCICFPTGRIRFIDKAGNPSGAPLQGQAILYLGNKTEQFSTAFSRFGPVLWTKK